LPDGNEAKYSAWYLPPGKEIIDFISGPRRSNTISNIGVHNVPHLGFAIRIDPDQRAHVNPFFWRSGTYKFVMQVSAPNVDKPGRLTLFVDWDGQKITIRSHEDPSQILDVIELPPSDPDAERAEMKHEPSVGKSAPAEGKGSGL
jgi:hypothetical protein